MTAAITHTLVSAVVDNGVAGEVGPDEWNDDHVIAGEDLTKSDDTNVTITLNGTPTGSMLEAVQLVLGWQGALGIGRGGTGQTTANAGFAALSPQTTNGDLITFAGGVPVRLATGTAGQFLGIAPGGTAPGYQGNLVFEGYGAAGRTTAPNANTAGDFTATRLNVGDNQVFASSQETVLIQPASIVPAQAVTAVMRVGGTFAPSTTNRNTRGILISLSVTPSATNSSEHYGLHSTVTHSSGAFAPGNLYGVAGFLSAPTAATVAEMNGGYFSSSVNGATGTLVRGVRTSIEVLSGTITTGVGVDIQNTRTGGTFTTSIGLRIQAASGTIGTDIAIQSLGGQNRFVGAMVVGANAAPTTGYGFDAQNIKERHTHDLSSSTTLDAAHLFTGTITNSGVVVGGMHLSYTFSGGSDSPVAFILRPFFAPSGNITDAMGASLAAIQNPNSNTITNLIGFRPVVASFSNTGAVTNGFGIRCDGPTYTGSVRFTSCYGISVANQGVASQTNAIGIHIASQSGSTNNYDMSFGRVDTTAAGAYYGRIPVLYNGLLKYLHVFSA